MDEILEEYCRQDVIFTEKLYELITNPLKGAPMDSSYINGRIQTIEELLCDT